MRLVTWNVNSLNARIDRILEWLDLRQPDVVCIQETKLADADFPDEVFEEAGYESAHHGLNQWNGVAILSKVGLADVHTDFDDGGDADRDARIMWATCSGLRIANCYVPNGRSIDDEHYQYKLGWLDRLTANIAANYSSSDKLCVVGDFNIAPDDRDVYDAPTHLGATHVSPDERKRLADLNDWGLTDIFRAHHDEAALYSWWDYRKGDFHMRRGMRIDLILGTQSVLDATTRIVIDRNARKGKLPSDHAPVVADLLWP